MTAAKLGDKEMVLKVGWRSTPPSPVNCIRVIVHTRDSEPFIADMDGLPGPTDTFVQFRNVFNQDRKPAKWLTHGIHTIMYSAAQITFIEVYEDIKADWIVKE
jgi:hypothetical protein